MTKLRILFFVLSFCCAVPNGFAQKKAGDKDQKEVVRASGRRGNGNQAAAKPQLENPSANSPKETSGNFELKAQIESDRLAKAYGIETKKSRQQLLKACRKYYKAKELLDRQYKNATGKKNAKNREQRERILEREYGKELRRILPES